MVGVRCLSSVAIGYGLLKTGFIDVYIAQDLKIYVKFLQNTQVLNMGRYWILVSGSWIKAGMLFYLSSIKHPISSIASVQLMEYDYAQLVGLRRSFASIRCERNKPNILNKHTQCQIKEII